MKANGIGEFIQQLRKEKGITQKELADIIGMSDKTISKWESGNSLPDTSILVSLCKALDISVNELLSCEKIPPEDYSKKAEENIMTLMKENEENKKENKTTRIIGIVLGIVLFAAGICLRLINTDDGYAGLLTNTYDFIDMLSLVLIFIFEVGIILISDERSKSGIMLLINKTIIPVGAVISLISLVLMLNRLDDPSTFGPNIAVVVLAFLYSCIIKIVLEVLVTKKKHL
ncbi:MAG: helix-turn-helix domain-containing protein [Lachnospiraceae bacterium]|nr:helix-turn-helix domain-containing protein [Lachnospiraceae bacterium]